METKQYTDFLLSIRTLSTGQLRHLGTRVDHQLRQDDVNHALEQRLKKLSRCVHCQSAHIVRWGHNAGLQRFRCKQCSKTFNELTKTPFTRLRNRNKLGTYAQCMVAGKTLRQAAKFCQISLTTSFRWRHHFLAKPEQHKAKQLSGIVEVDETFFRESFKGKRQITHRKPRQRGGGKACDAAPLVPVLLMLDRSEHEADFVLVSDCIAEVHPCMENRIKADSVLCTDGSQLYPNFAKNHKLFHKRILNENMARTLESGTFHIQTVNNYTARLKAWLPRFYGVGTDYLANYLAWWRSTAFEELSTGRDWLNEALSP
ncbi:IS1595 family transposase [Shewanella youngdeokensis]|uniref:IS1595 family transposase n=1 Tax=Shewanella youngdeokensis TaxID=2999068 RepID=A0ABZ0JWP4_9GAMM|nr:IS1595 family transposase [Shewanella sp. DAU334]